MKRPAFIAIALIALFLALRLPGIHLPYHQDEWKNVSASETVEGAGGFFAHPPLMQMTFVGAYRALGADYFRLLPLLFSAAAGWLLFLVIRRRAGTTAAIWSTVFFCVCAYNIQGSLSPDVDGAILPFFFLLAVYSYDRWSLVSSRLAMGISGKGITPSASKGWFALFAAALLLGFLFKLSFVIVIGAFAVDYLVENRRALSRARMAAVCGWLALLGAGYIGLLYLAQALYPAFSIGFMLGHARDSAGGLGRNWLQIAVQAIKALYLLSPLLVMPLFFVSRDIFQKMRVFFLYAAFGLAFYLAIFDFSRAALDKYLLFLVVPLAAIAGSIVSHLLSSVAIEARPARRRAYLFTGVIVAAALVALNFLPQRVIALYPKTLWFAEVVHGHWDILNPFTGGSGPLGFYVSLLFILPAFIVALAYALYGLARKQRRGLCLIAIVLIGLSYNAVFAEEFLWGGLNGSAPEALERAVAYIGSHPEIRQVLTYNDIGAGDLSRLGVYAGRIYATPEAESQYRDRFAAFDGDYLVIDMPHLYEDGFYARFFASCDILFETASGAVSGRVYDCARAKASAESI